MNKAYEYAIKVLEGDIIAPIQVKKQCENFINEFDKLQHDENYPYMWNKRIEKKIIAIIKNLNFARGSSSSEPMFDHLTLSQWFIILNPFCWVWKAYPNKRKIREVIFTVARKNSKSVIACIYHILCFFLDEENQTAYIGSNTKQQASIIFEELTNIINASPNLLPYFDIKKTYIVFNGMDENGQPANKNCKIVPLSGDSRKADGTMVYHASVDELGASNDIFKMVSSLETGMFGPKNPLILKISTSYPIENEHNYWKEVVDELIKNTNGGNKIPNKWGLAYLIDEALTEIEVDGKKIQRWEDKSTWYEANPLIAEIPDLYQQLLQDYETKKQLPTDLHLFKTKNLNIWQSEHIDDGSFFMHKEKMEQYEMPELGDWKWWEGKQVFIGIDLSHSGTDNTSVSFVHYDYKNRKTYIKNIVYYPKNLAANKYQNEKIPYEKWSRQYDWCVAVGKETIDYEEVGKHIQKIINDNHLKVATVLYDDKFSFDLMKYVNENIQMELGSTKVWQGARGLGPALTELQKEFLDGNVRYAPSKLFVSACINGKIVLVNGKPRIEKVLKAKNKVDSLLSTFNAQTGVMVWKKFNKFGADYDIEVW